MIYKVLFQDQLFTILQMTINFYFLEKNLVQLNSLLIMNLKLLIHLLRSNRSSRSTADLLKVVSDRIARVFNRSGTRAVALDISKVFGRVWHAGLLQKT